jgi:rRNA maturation endonuclease Nob1
MDLIYCSACKKSEKAELDFCTHCGSALIESRRRSFTSHTILRKDSR